MNNKVTPMGPAPVLEYGTTEIVPKLKKEKSRSGLFDFANTEAIKQRVREAKLKPDPYDVQNFYHETGIFQQIARHKYFENTTLTLIVINALWISHDTDGNNSETIMDAKAYFVAADCLFFSYFLFELFVRFMAFKRKLSCLKDNWFKFDAALVSLYAFDPFVLGLIKGATGTSMALPTAVLRLLRLARLSRLVRMLRNLPELMIMIKGMFTASASVGYTLALLVLITYVFAIACVNLADADTEAGQEFFSTVPEAMHNLIIFGTFCDALADFILVVKRDSVPCFIISWMYIGLASLTVMNMLIGVLCEVISAVAEEEKEGMMVEKVNSKFTQIVKDLDQNNDGTLSWAEFEKILEHPEAPKALDSVNVDAMGMIDMAEEYFFDNGEPVEVSFEQFMSLLLDMRGGQNATLKDIMMQGKRSNQKFTRMQNRINDLEKESKAVNERLAEMIAAGKKF